MRRVVLLGALRCLLRKEFQLPTGQVGRDQLGLYQLDVLGRDQLRRIK